MLFGFVLLFCYQYDKIANRIGLRGGRVDFGSPLDDTGLTMEKAWQQACEAAVYTVLRGREMSVGSQLLCVQSIPHPGVGTANA